MTSKLAKRIKNIFWLLMMLALLLLGLAFQSGTDPLARFNREITIILALFVISAAGYAAFLLIAQRRADRELKDNLDEIIHGRSGSQVIVYLRAFDEGKAGLFSKLVASLSDPGGGDEDVAFDPEECISDAIAGHAYFVAVGDRAPSYGAAKIKSADETWQQLVQKLIDRAELVVMLPGMSKSALWELDTILTEPAYRRKTVLVMPRDASTKRKSQWAAIKNRAKIRHAVSWPSYMRSGCFFRLQEGANPLMAVRLEDFCAALEASLPAETETLLDKAWHQIPNRQHLRISD